MVASCTANRYRAFSLSDGLYTVRKNQCTGRYSALYLFDSFVILCLVLWDIYCLGEIIDNWITVFYTNINEELSNNIILLWADSL